MKLVPLLNFFMRQISNVIRIQMRFYIQIAHFHNGCLARVALGSPVKRELYLAMLSRRFFRFESVDVENSPFD